MKGSLCAKSGNTANAGLCVVRLQRDVVQVRGGQGCGQAGDNKDMYNGDLNSESSERRRFMVGGAEALRRQQVYRSCLETLF